MSSRIAVIALIAGLAAAAAAAATARAQTPRTGRLVVDTLHSTSLAANRYGDSPDREVLVYLPPSYDSASAQRYPVVYLLHGFGATDRSWVSGYRGFSIPRSIDSLVAAGSVREMIVVMPNANTRLGGSFFTNSSATGNWDDLVARELVAYVDARYRTMARAESRGLAGHSMGGYGTFAVGMRHAGDVYSALYALSGCCTHFDTLATPAVGAVLDADAKVSSLGDVATLGFYPKVYLAMSAAFSPNPSRPPLFVDLPFDHADAGWLPRASAQVQWVEHAPQDMIPHYVDRLKRLKGLAFDVGTRDQLVSPAGLAALDSAFSRAGITHSFETYDGDHTSGIGIRMITKVLPFFSRTLDFSPVVR
jgi:S-formylglutathione hydrolase